MHTLKYPEMKKLVMCSSDKVKKFTSELFPCNEKIFPNLEELGLSGKYTRMILQGDFPQHSHTSLAVLKTLEVRDDDSAGFPIGLLETFHNLHKDYLFSSGGHLDKHVGKLAVAQIKKLRLITLNHLKYLWKPDSKLDSNLTDLQVAGCQKLVHLVTSSLAKNIERLVTIGVYGCRAMTQVMVISEGDSAAKEEIVFRKLKSLDLVDLDSLTSFCSGNYTFKFPSLEYLCVIGGCPKMKIFTIGDLITPMVSVRYGEGDSDLNTIIQQLHPRKSFGEAIIEVRALHVINEFEELIKFPECPDTDEDSGTSGTSSGIRPFSLLMLRASPCYNRLFV